MTKRHDAPARGDHDEPTAVAFVGWTILELIILWALGIFRREPA
jgi:hypothetical protein